MSRPNFVLVVADSLRGDTLGCAGHPDVQTPCLDALAERGVMFPNHYAQAPVCGPSRTALWTGRYPHSNGCMANLVGVGRQERSFVESLADTGYQCLSFGSNHIQPEPGGFAELVSSRHDHVNSAYNHFLQERGLSERPDRIAAPFETPSRSLNFGLTAEPMDLNPDAFSTDRATSFIAGEHEAPFFLYLGLHQPHPPYLSDEAHYGMYDPDEIEIAPFNAPDIGRHPALQKRFEKAGYASLPERSVRQITALYYAAATFVDEQVGKVCQALEEAGLRENTHIIFTSDHGDFCGELGLYVKADVPIRPLIHVPLIWSGPGVAPERAEGFSEMVDVAPTILAAAEVPVPVALEGRSLFDTPRDWACAEIADIAWNAAARRYDAESWYISSVDERWHYLHATRPGYSALYDLAGDPHCHRNVIEDNPTVANELRARLLNHRLAAKPAYQDHSLASWAEFREGAETAQDYWRD
ncbi:MAG: sulfatase-like hydrolase/transferase [Victivallales bacterium]|nr:sulfatase-like hydrolase/transferase [Victivallales bacterium]